MKKLTVILLVLVFGAGAVAYAMSELKEPESQTYSWRYKMTVEIDTPEGVKTGSAVREIFVTAKYRPSYKPYPYHFSHKVKGEAVVVDLGVRGIIFVLISPDSYPEVTDTFKGPAPFTPEGIEFYNSLKDVKASLYVNSYPLIVTFMDLNDPMSVKLVKGKRFSVEEQKLVPENNFEKLFGDGVKLKDITIEMTDDDFIANIGDVLPWLTDLRGRYLNGSSTSKGAPLGLYGGNFKIGGGTYQLPNVCNIF